MKKKIVVLSGAGISAESGLKTFRDAGGLWDGHKIEDVATPGAWDRNMSLVLDFYNERRKQLLRCFPNEAHCALAELEKKYNVVVVTQNVDDLHERGGSSNVIHLHGELLKVRSVLDETLIYNWTGNIFLSDRCEEGGQLRPHIVWFGEAVPKMGEAILEVETADLMIVVGTSLLVYPAADLISFSRKNIQKWIIDPKEVFVSGVNNFKFIKEKASVGVRQLVKELMRENV